VLDLRGRPCVRTRAVTQKVSEDIRRYQKIPEDIKRYNNISKDIKKILKDI
jgi:hypothetical protein